MFTRQTGRVAWISMALALSGVLWVAVPPPAVAEVDVSTQETPRGTETAPEKPSPAEKDAQETEEPAARIEREIVVTAGEPDFATEDTIRVSDLEERAARDLVEALREQPGLSAHRRGPINLDPTIRGLQDGQVAVLVDGTRSFAAGPARMDSDLAHVSPHALENLRVVKGPHALTWGAGALAGVRAETFRPEFSDEVAWGGETRAGWSENGSVADGAATVYRSGGRTRFAVTLADKDHRSPGGGSGAASIGPPVEVVERYSFSHAVLRSTQAGL